MLLRRQIEKIARRSIAVRRSNTGRRGDQSPAIFTKWSNVKFRIGSITGPRGVVCLAPAGALALAIPPLDIS